MNILKKYSFTDYIQWFYIYCMVCFGGMATPFRMTHDRFSLFILFTSSFIILWKGHRALNLTKSYVSFLLVLALALLCVMVCSSLTLGTSLSTILTFEVVLATYLLKPQNFLYRTTLFIAFLAAFSLVMFILIEMLGFYTMVAVFSPISEVSFGRVSGEIYSYNFYIYNFVVQHMERNCGPFGEPGQYQCVLGGALFFILFYKTNFKENTKVCLMFLFVATMITTQSTSGYVSLLIIIAAYFLHGFLARHKDKQMNKAFRLLLVISIVFFCFTKSGHSFIETTISSKYDFKRHEILASGAARQDGIDSAVNLISSRPEVLFGMGYDDALENINSESGLLIYLLAVGLLPFSILYGFLARVSFKYSLGLHDAIAKLLIVLNMSLGQPHVLNPILFLIILYPYLTSKRIK